MAAAGIAPVRHPRHVTRFQTGVLCAPLNVLTPFAVLIMAAAVNAPAGHAQRLIPAAAVASLISADARQLLARPWEIPAAVFRMVAVERSPAALVPAKKRAAVQVSLISADVRQPPVRPLKIIVVIRRMAAAERFPAELAQGSKRAAAAGLPLYAEDARRVLPAGTIAAARTVAETFAGIMGEFVLPA